MLIGTSKIGVKPYDANQFSREHREPWHNGRSNHYIFDLNRDWAWATQIETQQRLKKYNRWLPHVHVDFHEQGASPIILLLHCQSQYTKLFPPFRWNFKIK